MERSLEALLKQLKEHLYRLYDGKIGVRLLERSNHFSFIFTDYSIMRKSDGCGLSVEINFNKELLKSVIEEDDYFAFINNLTKRAIGLLNKGRNVYEEELRFLGVHSSLELH